MIFVMQMIILEDQIEYSFLFTVPMQYFFPHGMVTEIG